MTDPIEYPKIETLFDRDKKTFKVVEYLREAAFSIPRAWLVTEKVDGTNIRVHYVPAREETFEDAYLNEDGAASSRGQQTRTLPPSVTFHGRTDAAQMPPFLRAKLEELFPVENFADFDAPMTLFGEGYGARIQKSGGNYRPHDVSFRLFDVVVYDKKSGFQWWLDWPNVVSVADALGIDTVPALHLSADLEGIVTAVRKGLPSIVGIDESANEFESEGVVCRTDPYLFMRNGQRLVFKLKTKDF